MPCAQCMGRCAIVCLVASLTACSADPHGAYQGLLSVDVGAERREFSLGSFASIQECGKVVDYELKNNKGRVVWIRPDWGFLSVVEEENWVRAKVVDGACLPTGK